MASSVDPRFEAELRRGVVQLVALQYLQIPRYGYDLVRLLGAAGFPVEEGTLYPILRRFEKQGVLSSRWDTEGARPRKYYELSDDGGRIRDAMLAAWYVVRDATEEALRRFDPGAASEGGTGGTRGTTPSGAAPEEEQA